jgi:hypothetical protein
MPEALTKDNALKVLVTLLLLLIGWVQSLFVNAIRDASGDIHEIQFEIKEIHSEMIRMQTKAEFYISEIERIKDNHLQ